MICSRCQTQNEDNAVFCVNCGKKVNEPSSEKLFCPNCGRESPTDAKFCEDCGASIIIDIRPMSSVSSPVIPPVPFRAIPQASAPVVKKSLPGWAFGLIVLLAAASMFEAYLLLVKQDMPVLDAVPNSSNTLPSALPALNSENCLDQRSPLYQEDFEDGVANDWGPGIQELKGGLSIAPAPDDKNNLALYVQAIDAAGDKPIQSRLQGYDFENAVLSLRFQMSAPLLGEKNWFSFNWHYANQPFDLQGKSVFDSRYQLPVGYNYFEMRRLQQPISNVSVGRANMIDVGVWHSLEIATYQPQTDVWLDGRLVMSYQDPKPLPPGTFGFEVWLVDKDVKIILDDIHICELGAPYKP